MNTYKAISLRKFGGMDELQIRSFKESRLRKNQLRVKVIASGICSGDSMIRSGVFPLAPKRTVLGYDLVGEVVETGSDLSADWLGKRIMAQTITGAWAETAVVSAAKAVEIDDSLPLEDAAALGLNYTTAYALLQQTGRGEVFFQGLSGGVGSALVDLTPMFPEITLSGTVSPFSTSHKPASVARQYFYNAPDLLSKVQQDNPNGYDWVIDPFGGRQKSAFRSVLADRGTILGIGYSGNSFAGFIGNILVYSIRSLFGQGYQFLSTAAMSSRNESSIPAIQEKILSAYKEKRITPLKSEVFTFKEYRAAFELFEKKGTTGKVVFVRSEEDWC